MKQTGFSLCLGFDEGSNHRVWKVHGPVDKHRFPFGQRDIYIGFSSPKGIVPLSTTSNARVAHFSYFMELEYISTTTALNLPIDYFCSLHSLREVRAPNSNLIIQPNTTLSTSLSSFHTLKVLELDFIPSSFLPGQAFHMLERFRERTLIFLSNPSKGQLIEMPVCNRLVVSLARLATLELPQIRELSVGIYGNNPKIIWEQYIVVNSNMSGLKLLHVHQQHYKAFPPASLDLMKILRSLPALETLIIDGDCIDNPYVDFFTIFVPIGAQKTTGLNQSGKEGQISGLLCPKLESLQIQGIHLIRQSNLMPVLKKIVTLHATIGSPLKSFTFYSEDRWQLHSERKWELIGKDRSFVLEEVPARRFQLDI